jgi:hypothetical protein
MFVLNLLQNPRHIVFWIFVLVLLLSCEIYKVWKRWSYSFNSKEWFFMMFKCSKQFISQLWFLSGFRNTEIEAYVKLPWWNSRSGVAGIGWRASPPTVIASEKMMNLSTLMGVNKSDGLTVMASRWAPWLDRLVRVTVVGLWVVDAVSQWHWPSASVD